jgi:DNA-binding LytR/AlgR family response regulator
MRKSIVLIVDDEALVRMGAVQIVEEAGLLALEAPNADAAIKILQSRADIWAVFTDINMTGSMDGSKLAHAIRGRWPPIHLIVTSGLMVEEKLPENSIFLPKPYSAEQVTAILNNLMSPHPSSDGFSNNNAGNCGKVA